MSLKVCDKLDCNKNWEKSVNVRIFYQGITCLVTFVTSGCILPLLKVTFVTLCSRIAIWFSIPVCL